MTEEIQNYFLKIIVNQWRSLPPHFQPKSVWIRRGSPLPPGASGLGNDTVIEAAWFLDESGLQPRSVDEFSRFWAALLGEGTRSIAAGSSEEETLESGYASFASYSGEESYYLDVVWGSLFGRAWKIGPSPEGPLEGSELLWMS